VKKLFFLVCLVVLSVPYGAFADGFHHHQIRGNEMAAVGFGAATLVGAVGYLLLRRRNSA
jgi:MYXO-CTERM domain-containing protein